MKATANNKIIDATGDELARKYNLKLNSTTGLYDCDGDVKVGKDLVKDGRLVIRFGTVDGGFDCSKNKLISLGGCPQKVGGFFDCSVNSLTSLEGAPQKVGKDFYCDHNYLTSLKGCPQEVGCDFYCEQNVLSSLEGAPQSIGGWFYCANNNLTTLEGAPQKVGGNFDCSNNSLTSLKGAPQKVGGTFDCSNNSLTSLEGAPQELGDSFFCDHNNLSSLKGAPQEVGRDFDCQRTVLDCKDTANVACNAPDATKTKINVIVRTDEGFTVETHNPLVEARLAKEFCDKVAKEGGEHTVNTVSTDATVVYCDYASEVLGIEVHIYLDGKEVTMPELFTSYNKAIDYCSEILGRV